MANPATKAANDHYGKPADLRAEITEYSISVYPSLRPEFPATLTPSYLERTHRSQSVFPYPQGESFRIRSSGLNS